MKKGNAIVVRDGARAQRSNMTAIALTRSRVGSPGGRLALLLAVGLAIRLATLPARGFPGDVDELVRWATALPAVGPGEFYASGRSANYPAMLYPLWAMGALLHGPALALAIKALSIPFDLGLGLGLYAITRRGATEGAGILAAGLYLLNPSVVLAGSYWGQIDAIGTSVYLGALVALAARRFALAGALAALAGLVKPQFGLVALPLAAVLVVELARTRNWKPGVLSAAGGVATFAALTVPLRLSPLSYIALVRDASAPWPYTSLYAFNPWGLSYGFLQPDGPYLVMGALLLGAGLMAALFPLTRRTDLAALLAVGTFIVFAFYFLPTRVHERYLFPAIALLAPLAAVRPRLLAPYVVLSTCFTLSLLYMLSQNAASTGVVAPAFIDSTLFSWAGVVVIGITLMGMAALLVVRLLRSEMALSFDGAA